jgi:hypothetical protein
MHVLRERKQLVGFICTLLEDLVGMSVCKELKIDGLVVVNRQVMQVCLDDFAYALVVWNDYLFGEFSPDLGSLLVVELSLGACK